MSVAGCVAMCEERDGDFVVQGEALSVLQTTRVFWGAACYAGARPRGS